MVGGNKVNSNHGTFRFNLGPGENAEFHEIVCIGMSDVTAGFGSYDLSEIAEKYRDQAGPEKKDVVLPERVGGSKVQLLLGIKNANLDPVLVKILPSGIAVYRSPFKDVYGSRMIFVGPHKSFTKDDKGVKIEMSNAVFFLRDQTPVKEEVADEPVNDLLDFSVLTADVGKGVAEELLIDLEMGPVECVAEELLIDLNMDIAELDRFRSLSRIQTPDRAGYMENLEEELLINMNPAELERFRFQPWVQTPNEAGYLENLEEDAMIPGLCRLGDESDLRISNSLDDLLGIRGDNSEFSRSLGVNEMKLEKIFNIDNVLLHQRVKSCRLSEINNIMSSVFHNSNCTQKLVCWKKAKMINSRGYKYSKSLLINILEKGGVTFIEH